MLGIITKVYEKSTLVVDAFFNYGNCETMTKLRKLVKHIDVERHIF